MKYLTAAFAILALCTATCAASFADSEANTESGGAILQTNGYPYIGPNAPPEATPPGPTAFMKVTPQREVKPVIIDYDWLHHTKTNLR